MNAQAAPHVAHHLEHMLDTKPYVAQQTGEDENEDEYEELDDEVGGTGAGVAPHLQAGLIAALPLVGLISTYATVLAFLAQDPAAPAPVQLPVVLNIPLNFLLTWLLIGLPFAMLRLGDARHANSASYGQLVNRVIGLQTWSSQLHRDGTIPADIQMVLHSIQNNVRHMRSLLAQVGPGWIIGTAYITVWRQLDHADVLLNYLEPRYRVWARAHRLLLRISSSPRLGTADMRDELVAAMHCLVDLDRSDACTAHSGPRAMRTTSKITPTTDNQARASIAQIQYVVATNRTDRYSGLLRARNQILATCTMTSLVLYAMFWLGIVALNGVPTQRTILGSALFYTTLGGLVGLFHLMYLQSGLDTAIDDYGLSMARIVVAPQLAGLAALVGVVLTSLASATLSSTPNPATTITEALGELGRSSNVAVAVAFALSPGLLLSRFRNRTEAAKQDLSDTGGPQPAAAARGGLT